MTRYEEVCETLLDLPRFTKKHDLAHAHSLLGLLGVDGGAVPVIHIAGTNGKGSVANYLNSILLAAGRTTGLFTSPHLVTMRERIRVNGEMAEETVFCDAFDAVQEAVENSGLSTPTFFETLFLMAMRVFADAGVSHVILEAGLGGLSDTTNVVARPLLSVITSVSLDHEAYLGNTIREVAAQKAGIIKAGCPVIYNAGRKEAARVIRERAEELSARAIPVAPDDVKILSFDGRELSFSYTAEGLSENVWRVRTAAGYQAVNAAQAIAAASVIGIRDADVIQKGLTQAFWPARMQEIAPGIFLDGAHNPDAATELAATVRLLKGEKGAPCHLVCGLSSDKDCEGIVRIFSEKGLFTSVTASMAASQRALEADALAELFRKYTDVPVSTEPDAAKALAAAAEEKGPDGIVIAAGSLYFAGELLDRYPS